MTLFPKISRVPTLAATFVVVMQFVSAEIKKKTLHCFVYKFYLLANADFVSFYENQIEIYLNKFDSPR